MRAVLAALLLAACSSSEPFHSYPGEDPVTGRLAQYPPDKFKRNATFVVITVPQDRIEDSCRKNPNIVTLACSLSPYVIVPNPCEFPGDYYAELLCHEKAHINGWNSKHDN